MKKILKITVALFFTVHMGSSQAQHLAQSKPWSAEEATQSTKPERLNQQLIKIDTAAATSLESSLQALARAGGYQLILKPGSVLSGTLQLNDGPFNQLWHQAASTLDFTWEIWEAPGGTAGKQTLVVDARPTTKQLQLQSLTGTEVLKVIELGQVKAAIAGSQIVITGKKSEVEQMAELISQLDQAEQEKQAQREQEKQASEQREQAAKEKAARELTEKEQAKEQAAKEKPKEESTKEIWETQQDANVLASIIKSEFGIETSVVGKKILLSGSKKSIEEARSLLTKLDGPKSQERIQLKELPPGTAALLLRSRVPGLETLAEPRGSAVLIRGSNEQIEQAKKVLAEADLPEARVEVQVRIQELTERAQTALGLGLEGSYGGLQVISGQNGLKTTFDPTRIGLGFNIIPSLDLLESQGLTRRVYQGQVSLRPLQDGENDPTENAGASSVAQSAAQAAQSAAQSAAQAAQSAAQNAGGPNNQSSAAQPTERAGNGVTRSNARIQSGGVLELNIPGNGGSEAIKKTFPYGLSLEFSDARLSPSGAVELIVRSAITGAPASLSNPQLLSFTNTEAAASIRLKDGETAMLAGLTAKEIQKDNSGIPLLTRIPILGALAGKQDNVEKYSQLLVVIQVRVVR